MKTKKKLSLSKLKEKAGEGDWRKSTYAHAIDAFKTNIFKIENTTTNALQFQKLICEAAASLNNVKHLFAETDNVELQCQANLKLLKTPAQIKENIDILDTFVAKQRTDKWFSDRKSVKVTGSTIYKALGCESLKTQNTSLKARLLFQTLIRHLSITMYQIGKSNRHCLNNAFSIPDVEQDICHGLMKATLCSKSSLMKHFARIF